MGGQLGRSYPTEAQGTPPPTARPPTIASAQLDLKEAPAKALTSYQEENICKCLLSGVLTDISYRQSKSEFVTFVLSQQECHGH